jgi:excisionase family DNA binding protein
MFAPEFDAELPLIHSPVRARPNSCLSECATHIPEGPSRSGPQRSEDTRSGGPARSAALTAGTETKQSQPGEAETPTTDQRKPVATTHERKMIMSVAPEEPRLLLGIEEAARRLGIGRSLMYRLALSGEVESVHVGRLRRIPAERLAEHVTRLRGEARGRRSTRWAPGIPTARRRSSSVVMAAGTVG